jgi:hypothetical protein
VKGGRRFVNVAKSGRFAAQSRADGAVHGRKGIVGRGAGKKRGPATAGPRTRHHS